MNLTREENAMEYATLGNTGLLVSKLCFGTMTFGDGRGLFKAISTIGQSEADELIKTSIDGGINFFDTADNYTEGESGKILGQSLKNLNIARKDVVIATSDFFDAVRKRGKVNFGECNREKVHCKTHRFSEARAFDWHSILLIHSSKEGCLEAAIVNQNWLFDS
jgi:aryl-alcohol dehydrogenase-like predicted oxidoreductase